MTKIKNYFLGNSFRLKVVLAVLVLILASAPTLYAQFIRHDGDPAGWGYGYGYGYGAGYGWDEGTTAGYRTGGGNLDQFAYGYGYGNLAAGQSYDADNDLYTYDIADIGDLYLTGLLDIVSSGGVTTSFAFTENTQLDITADVSVSIPAGTTFTKTGGGTMTNAEFLTLTGDVPTITGLATGYTSEGAVSFGIPTLGLTASQAVTLTIGGLSALNGEELTVFHQAPGSTTWTELTSCTVASGLCTFTATSFSSFSAASYTAPASGGGGGGGIILVNNCTAVTYDAWSSCVNSIQSRNIITQTPTNCAPTAEQLAARTQFCAVTADGSSVPLTNVSDANYLSNVMETERRLTTRTNAALTTRLLGRILLQVEEKGQAWYLEPVSRARHFMGRPADAFNLMRRFGLGISNANLTNFQKTGVPAKFAGRIFLQVQAHGEAYYVNPTNMKLHYLGRPDDALRIMRELSLGISNANIRQIAVGK